MQQARIRLKNSAAGRGRVGWPRYGSRQRTRSRRCFGPGHELLADEGRWRSLEDGLSVYLAPGFCAALHGAAASVEETLVVGSRFYVLPLLPLLEQPRRVPAARAQPQERSPVRREPLRESREIDLPGVPKSLTDAVGSDYEEDSVQVHTVRPGSGGAIVHGHGVGQGEDEKEEATRFCLRVDAGLRRILLGAANGARPLVIAAAEPLASIYAQVSHYPNLMPEGVAGNPEPLSRRGAAARRAWTHRREERCDRELESRARPLPRAARRPVARRPTSREIVLAALRRSRRHLVRGARARGGWGAFDPADAPGGGA